VPLVPPQMPYQPSVVSMLILDVLHIPYNSLLLLQQLFIPQQQPQLVNGLQPHISVTPQPLQLSPEVAQPQFQQLLQLDVPLAFSLQLGQVAVLVIAVIL